VLASVPLFPSAGPSDLALKTGFRFGAIGTHTSRTMMLSELSAAFGAVPTQASREDFSAAIIDGNCLGKKTGSTRRLSFQRLSELYALDREVPIHRVLRNLWSLDEPGRPLLALQCAIARDPLLAATATAVVNLAPGGELQRNQVAAALREAVGDRLSDATLEKVIRNTSSSWVQSGHLVGRTFKKRVLVRATPATASFGLYLAYAAGFRGPQLFSSGWLRVLDCTPSAARDLAVEAKRIGLIDFRASGEIVDLVLDRLDPFTKRS